MNKPPLPLESARTAKLLRWLRSTYPHSYWFKVHGNPYQPRVVDIFGCWEGQTVAVEVKRPNRTLTLHQKKTLAELSRAGAITMRAWDENEIANILQKFAIDKLAAPVYSRYIDGRATRLGATNSSEGEKEMAPKKSSAPAKRGSKAKEDIEELEDLDDLDEEDEDEDDEDEDLDDEDEEDDEDEDEEDDEDEDEDEDEPPAKSKAKAKSASKSKAKAEPAKKKARGNPGNLTPRRVSEGMVGAAAIAEELGSDGRTVRVHLRKLKTEKSENGLYEWKAGSKAFKDVVKAVQKSMTAAAKEKAASKK